MTKYEIMITIAAIMILASLIYNGAFGSSNTSTQNIKVYLYIQYSDLAKNDKHLGKAVIDYYLDHENYNKRHQALTFDATNHPSKVSFTIKNIAKQEAFETCLSSYKFDEGNCIYKYNGGSPEKVQLRFPA